METKLTTMQVAERLGISQRRVIALIEQKKLPAEKFANVYMINETDVALIEVRKPGRPPKKKKGDSEESP